MVRAAKKFDFLFIVMIGAPGMLYSQATKVATTGRVIRHDQTENVALPVDEVKSTLSKELLEKRLVEARKEIEDREREKIKEAEAKLAKCPMGFGMVGRDREGNLCAVEPIDPVTKLPKSLVVEPLRRISKDR